MNLMGCFISSHVLVCTLMPFFLCLIYIFSCPFVLFIEKIPDAVVLLQKASLEKGFSVLNQLEKWSPQRPKNLIGSESMGGKQSFPTLEK